MATEPSTGLQGPSGHITGNSSAALVTTASPTTDSIGEDTDGYMMVIQAYASENSENINPAPPQTPRRDPQAQDSPTSPTSPTPELSDPEYPDPGSDTGGTFLLLTAPHTPAPNPARLFTSSPLSPCGSRRALQRLTPRVAPPSHSPSGNKLAHQSKPSHYSKLRSKLRKDRERELVSQKGVMGKSKLEDKRIRERMINSLRKNMTVPDETRAAIKALIKSLPAMPRRDWAERLEKFTFMDFCEIWRFQYLEPEELIQLKNWENTGMDDKDAICYAIGYLRQQVGLPAGGKG
ncbi:hypothetical protein ABW21_db0203006 [Orbilia brochopaga]|nr:hypothetical protein ABW21_db0203006 [Drechslerella brochopaga]